MRADQCSIATNASWGRPYQHLKWNEWKKRLQYGKDKHLPYRNPIHEYPPLRIMLFLQLNIRSTLQKPLGTVYDVAHGTVDDQHHDHVDDKPQSGYQQNETYRDRDQEGQMGKDEYRMDRKILQVGPRRVKLVELFGRIIVGYSERTENVHP